MLAEMYVGPKNGSRSWSALTPAGWPATLAEHNRRRQEKSGSDRQRSALGLRDYQLTDVAGLHGHIGWKDAAVGQTDRRPRDGVDHVQRRTTAVGFGSRLFDRVPCAR